MKTPQSQQTPSGGSDDRIVRLSEPMREALARLTSEPQTPSNLRCCESTLKALVNRGMAKQVIRLYEPWKPIQRENKYYLPNVQG